MEESNKITITVSQVQRQLSIKGGSVLTALMPIFLYSVIQLIRLGNQDNYVLLLIGSMLSFVATMGYIIAELLYGVKKKKSFIAMLLAFGGFMPYLFGCYIVVTGFLSLWQFFHSFALFTIIKAILFIILGDMIVSNFYKITEVSKYISSNDIIVDDK